MNNADVTAVIARLLAMSYQERANNNCISVRRRLIGRLRHFGRSARDPLPRRYRPGRARAC